MVTNLLFSSLVEQFRLNSVKLVFICIRNALGCRVAPEELGSLISALVVLVSMTLDM